LDEYHLDWLSARADTEVDELIERVQPPPLDTPGAMLRHLVEEAPEVGAFLDRTTELPDWADEELLRRAEEFFRVWGLHLCVGLFFAGLPRSYTAPWSALALQQSAGFESDVRRRLSTTGRFLVDLMSLDDPEVPLRAGGRGQQTVQMVRLYHGAVRRWLNDSPDRWDAGRAPIPLNQEEMLAGVILFSAGALDALDRMGVVYSEADADAYVHTWCVAGALLGVGRLPGSPIEFPLTAAEARRLGLVIQERHRAPSAAGQELAQGLVTMAEQVSPKPLRWLPRTMLRELTGDPVADTLGVTRGPMVGHALLRLLRAINPTLSGVLRCGPAACLAAWIGRRVIYGYLNAEGHTDGVMLETLERWRTARRPHKVVEVARAP
jgi:hypothetical protein